MYEGGVWGGLADKLMFLCLCEYIARSVHLHLAYRQLHVGKCMFSPWLHAVCMLTYCMLYVCWHTACWHIACLHWHTACLHWHTACWHIACRHFACLHCHTAWRHIACLLWHTACQHIALIFWPLTNEQSLWPALQYKVLTYNRANTNTCKIQRQGGQRYHHSIFH